MFCVTPNANERSERDEEFVSMNRSRKQSEKDKKSRGKAIFIHSLVSNEPEQSLRLEIT